jgi:isopentenyldiphosphate isomerase
MVVQQNDPEELLEVFDAAGRGTGRTKTRAAVHLEGDWHQAFHCWIVRRQGQEVVLQRRALLKDTYPGCWDAAAAGHWRFGETPRQAAREIVEELGLEVDFAELAYRGRERSNRRLFNGLIDREHHQVYVLETDRALSEYRPDPAEVSAVGAFPTAGLLALLSGRLANLAATEALAVDSGGRLEPIAVSLRKPDLVPYSAARLRRMLRPDSSR